jgi:acyl-CoA thioesterase II
MSSPASPGVLEDLLDLEELDTNLYRAGNPAEQYMPHLYGGQVAAQALRAAANTVPEGRFPHSIHGYFLRGGHPDRPTIMAVDRDRDGASFSARHVNALQEGEVIFSALASFHVDEEGVDYQLPNLPADVADPDSMPERDRLGHNAVFDLRYFSPVEAEPWRASRMWAQPRGVLADDRVTRACALTYLSDMGWAFYNALGNTGIAGPSLDHAVWFHRSVTVNQWVLLDLYPVSVAGARGVYVGTIHDRTGTLAASLAQEKLLRPPRPPR